jgi:serine/threonine-protein kinase
MGAQISRLVLRSASTGDRVFELPSEGVLRAGASPSCQIHLPLPGVLDVHFFVKCQQGRAAVIVQDKQPDLILNGAAVRRKLLEHGDTIRIGDAILAYDVTDADPLTGKSLSGYRIEARLGRGAMGTVYKATQLSLERSVAFKILSPELTKDADFVREFLSEARAAAKLNHPNVVQVYDAGAVSLPVVPPAPGDGQEGDADADAAGGQSLYFFSMEFLPGGTLSALLEREGRLDLIRALEVGRDTARALVWAEEQGIVHRDIKPDNLLFAADGTVKLADLGIAADRYSVSGGDRRPRGVGSPRYMAPEQASGKTVDHRADIYALGCTLYRALAGKPPFEGKTAAEILRAKSSQDPPLLDSVVTDVPQRVAKLIARMMARDPMWRPATCVEVLSDLEECLEAAKGGPGAFEVLDEAHAPRARGAARRRGRGPGKARAGAGEPPFVETVSGQATLALSGLMILSSVVWAVLYDPSPMEGAGPPVQVTETVPGSPTVPPDAVVDAKAVAPPEGAPPPPGDPEPVTRTKARPPATGPDSDLTTGLTQAEAAIVRELIIIRSSYKLGTINNLRAIEEVTRFKKEHPEAVFQERADGVITYIRGVRELAGKKELEKVLGRDVAPLLKGAKYREAAEKVAEVAVKYPEVKEAVEKELAAIETAALEGWKKTEAEADRLVEAGDHERALALLRESLPILPARKEKAGKDKVAAVEALAKEFAEMSKALSAEIDKVEAASTALDFEKAVATATAIPAPKHPKLIWRRALVLEDARRAKEAWDALRAGIPRAAQLDVVFEPWAGGSPGPFKVKSLSGANVAIEAAGGAKEDPREVFSLGVKSLVDLVAAGSGASPATAVAPRLLEGLGLLLLGRHGPDRAKDVLLDARLGPEKQEAYRARLKEEEEPFLARVARNVEARAAALRARSPSAALTAEWNALAADLSRWIPLSRKLAPYVKHREALAKAFIEARSGALRSSVPQSLFAGHVESYGRDGSIEISYDFSSVGQFKDFIPVNVKDGTPSQMELDEEGIAKIRGEFRILKGDVFRNRLGVRVNVPANGYSPQAPNINVALWTSDLDRVSPPAEDAAVAPEAGPTPPGLPDDFFVFAIGYKAQVYNHRIRAFDYLSLRGASTTVQMPANAIIGGRRGSPLHSFAEEDCAYAAGMQSLRGAQVLRVIWSGKPGELPSWIINRPVSLRDVKATDLFERTKPYSGSVTFFTNGEVVYYTQIVIEGELNPAWVEGQLAGTAEKELKKMEPGYPFRAAAADELTRKNGGADPGGEGKKKAAPAPKGAPVEEP